jgi:hypothetical protein
MVVDLPALTVLAVTSAWRVFAGRMAGTTFS